MLKNIETMTYKMQPAGHEEQQPKRKYPEPDKRLAEAFEKWVEKCCNLPILDSRVDDWYHEAVVRTAHFDGDLETINGLIYAYQDHPKIAYAGAFVSTLYNKIPDKDIVYDLNLEAKIDWLGLNLSSDKILVNKSNVGSGFGASALGTIINSGKALDGLGSEALGYVINLGSASISFANSSKGPVINDGDCGPYAWERAKGLFINFSDTGYDSAFLMMNVNGKIIGDKLHKGLDLYEYLTPIKQELQEIRADHTKARKFVEAHPRKNLREDLLNIMKRYHHVD